jgi:nitrogenase molybdenum-iron protein alpha/beta subunit
MENTSGRLNRLSQATDFSQRLNYSYLLGVYLAINAIQDAFLLVDGPTCIFHKAEHVFGKHDLFSTLLDCSGRHRIQYSGTDTKKITTDYEGDLKTMLSKLAALDICKALFISSIPFCTLAGTDYTRLIKEATRGILKTAYEIPGRSLEEDWLQGYAQTLDVLAKNVDLSKAKPKKDTAAIVGYLMDRHEGDHSANLEELKRIFESLGMNLCSVWLSGSTYGALEDVKHASVIYAFPYGRQAAYILGERLNVPVVETPLPFGIEMTLNFVKKIMKHSKNNLLGNRFINTEMSLIVTRLEWAVPTLFLNRHFIWIGDPYGGAGVMSLLLEMGGHVDACVLTSNHSHVAGLLKNFSKFKTAFYIEPKRKEWRDLFKTKYEKGTDLVIGDTTSLALLTKNAKTLEFGFPSYFHHCFQQEPFMGFKGVLSFVQRMANAILETKRG